MLGPGVVVPAAALAVLAGCAQPDRQWYKPGAAYTLAEFERDQQACTRARELDEACMKARGWVPLTGDRYTPQYTEPPPTFRSPRRTY